MIKNCLFILFFLLSVASFAQENSSVYAIKFGLTHSSIRDNGSPYNVPAALVPVITGGLVYISPIKRNLFFQAELNYTQKGDVYEFPGGFNNGKTITKVKINVIEIPLLVRIQAKKDKKAIPYLNGGLSLGFVVGKSNISTRQFVPNFRDFKNTIQKEVFSPFDPGIVAGIGIKLQEAFMFELRYSRGIINIFPGTSKPQVISLSSLFRFR